MFKRLHGTVGAHIVVIGGHDEHDERSVLDSCR